MSAQLREEPVRLPGVQGLGAGLLVADADDAELAACLARDQVWLHGGEVEDEDDPGSRRVAVGFLADSTRNPRGQDAEAFINDVNNNERDRRVVARVLRRVQAIQQEQQRREQEARAARARASEDARSRLAAHVHQAPAIDDAYRRLAHRASEAWGRVSALAEDLELLTSLYSSQSGSITVQHEEFRAGVTEAARATGQRDPALEPLPDAMPTYQAVRKAVQLIGAVVGGQASVPSTGLDRVKLKRLVAQSRGEE